MIRNLKVLGLALVAVFAMSAMVASAASAAGALTSDGPVTIKGTDKATQASSLTQFGQTIICKESHYTAHKYNVTPHTFIPNGATTFTITPTYTNCSAAGLLATVTMNGCDYVLHIVFVITAGEKYGGTTDIVCPAGAQIEVHIYASATKENVVTCTVKVPAQTGLGGGFVKNLAGGKLLLGGPVEKITASKEGGCGTEENALGTEDIEVESEGKNEAGGTTSVSITG